MGGLGGFSRGLGQRLIVLLDDGAAYDALSRSRLRVIVFVNRLFWAFGADLQTKFSLGLRFGRFGRKLVRLALA